MLAGYSAMTYDQELRSGFADCQEKVQWARRTAAPRLIGGDAQRIRSLETQFTALTYKHLLLPVWILAYVWQNQTYQVIFDAYDGEVDGERPYSWIKIATLVLTLGLLLVIVIVAHHRYRTS
jgi:hypothetical protein